MRVRFRSEAWAIVLGLILLTGVSNAQPPGGGRGFRGGPGGPGGLFNGGGIANLLQQQDVQREIELNEEQLGQLRTLGDEVREQIRGQMQDAFGGMRDMTDEERQARFDEIRAKMEKIQKDVEGRLQKVLLPNQFDRLKQIDLQSRLQRGGGAALADGELAEALGLSDGQREQIRQRSEQVQQDLQDKIRQLRLDARNQLLDVLTAEQRAKLESMMGEQFKLPEDGGGPPQFGRRGGGPLDRGGRAGRGGRNRGGAQDSAPAGANNAN